MGREGTRKMESGKGGVGGGVGDGHTSFFIP